MLDSGLHEEQRCTQNCRTARENFILGYETAVVGTLWPDGIRELVDIRMEADREWKRIKKTAGYRLR